MYLIWRLRGRKTNIPDLRPRWGLLFLFAYIAGLSHILLDFTNNYGVRPFWPFWGTWYSWDIVFIVEPLLYVLLIAGFVRPDSSRAQRRCFAESLRRFWPSCLCSGSVRGSCSRTPRSECPGEADASTAAAGRVSVYPYWSPVLSDLRWYAVVETRDHFVSSEVNVWSWAT